MGREALLSGRDLGFQQECWSLGNEPPAPSNQAPAREWHNPTVLRIQASQPPEASFLQGLPGLRWEEETLGGREARSAQLPRMPPWA